MNFPGKKIPSFQRGLGAEFVFRTEEGIAFISGGRTLRLMIVAPQEVGARHRLVLADGGNDRVILEGGATEVYARFCEIEKQCMAPPRVNVGRKGVYAALAAFTAVYLIFCHPVVQPDTSAASPGVAGPAGLEQIMERLQKVADGTEVPGSPAAAAAVPPVVAPPASPAKEAVTDRPEFLSLPEEAPARQPSASETPQEPPQEAAQPQAPALPAYTPDLYQAKPAAPTTPQIDPAPAPSTSSPPVASPQIDPPAKPEQPAASEPQKTSAADTAVKEPAVAAVDPKGVEKADPDAAKAVETAMKNGMDQQDALETLKQLGAMMKMDPAAITPEMLSKLPHEIAQQLKETGVLANPAAMPETGDAPYKAIRLPEEVIEKYRGKDGIASIPENDTYAALGNRVVLQLPGGGDIRKPEDLKGFGFNP